MNFEEDDDRDDLVDVGPPMSYHINGTQRAGEPLPPETLSAICWRVWDVLFAILGSEEAVVKAAMDDEASVSAAAIILWEGAWEKACEAGRRGLATGVRVDFGIGFHYTF